MPWVPELFSAPVLQEILDRRRAERMFAVPYFDGLLAGEPDALVGSFAAEPEVYDPMRGRVKGERAFRDFVAERGAWFKARNVALEDVQHVIASPHGCEEVIVHLDGEHGRVALPFAIVADRRDDGRLTELRLYYSHWALNGRHFVLPPLLQHDPRLRLPHVVDDYRRALAAGDVDAIVAAFEAGEDVRAFYERRCADGGVELEPCTVIEDGSTCAVEYNVVRWGSAPLQPQAGVAVFVRGERGRLAAARLYDDVAPPGS